MIKSIAAISAVYDLTAGLTLLLFPQILSRWFAIPLDGPSIFLTLNGLFLTAVGVGYVLPYRDPVGYRAYLWIFGVGLKTAGAAAFTIDYFTRASGWGMLLFAIADGIVAALTLAALARKSIRRD